MNLRDVVTLADLDLIKHLIEEYRVQSDKIEKDGGVAGYSRGIEKKLAALYVKLGGTIL